MRRGPAIPLHFTRRAYLSALLACPVALGQSKKGEMLPAEVRRYSDPTTELEVIRLTDPAFASALPAEYSRAIAHGNLFLLYASNRGGSLQAFRADLKTGQARQLTDAEGLDGASLTMTPDNRAYC